MLNKVLEEGKRAGFSTVEAYGEKNDRHEFRFYPDYRADHRVKSQKICTRAFWRDGGPCGFSLTSPRAAAIKQAFAQIHLHSARDSGKNFAHQLPESVELIKPEIFDPAIHEFSIKQAEEMEEAYRELIVQFPGLQMKTLFFQKELKKVSLYNSNGFAAKYRKSIYSLHLDLSLNESHIQVSEYHLFADRFNPSRIISRAYNLLHSLQDKSISFEKKGQLILSQEASCTILREFSSRFKLGGENELMERGINLPTLINLIDNPLLSDQPGSVPFDDEGIQRGEKQIIRRGRFEKPISDLKTAHRNRSKSTGNGFRRNGNLFPSPQFSNLFLKPSILPLNKLMNRAGRGILVSLIKLKHINYQTGAYIFSAYGYRFQNESIGEAVHFQFETSFETYFHRFVSLSKELRFFNSQFNIGSPYVLVESHLSGDGMINI